MKQSGLKYINSKWMVIFAYLICLAGVLIFAKGFFPTKSTSNMVESGATHPNAPRDAATLSRLLTEDFVNIRGKVLEEEVINSDGIPAPYQKLVLVVVDAMRADFITSSHHAKNMPFLHNTINSGHGVMYMAKAKAPTVTMPRLKALCTGSIPGYIDVLLNMDQALELKEDNIISRFLSAEKDIVFFGDNVWLKLFPGSFMRHEGTTAFFVTDYTEVDFNVTRHLSRELRDKYEWDVMILHYLGMDHIGHLAGPTSPLMPPKLAEMDSILSTIYSGLKDEANAMIVVTSDHGMSEQGSHGGTTTSEVETPLIFIQPATQLRPEDNDESKEFVEQTDFASTIAILFGVRIPSGSMGHVIPSMLNVLKREEQLYALQYNCHQLLSLAAKSISLDAIALTTSNPLAAYRHGLNFHNEFLDGKHKGNAEWFHSARTNYITCLTTLSDKLTSKLASYDYGLMAFGSVVLLIGFCGILFLWFTSLLRNRHVALSKSKPSKSLTRILVALMLGCLLHAATLPGSSFVEEEHQIWHFLTISIVIAMFVAFLRTIARTEKASTLTSANASVLYDTRLFKDSSALRRRNDKLKDSWDVSHNDNDPLNQNDSLQSSTANEIVFIDDTKDRSIIKKHHLSHVGIGFCALVVHRVLKSWNQTGIKYAAEPDIGDWFKTPQNKPALSILSSGGLLLVCLLSELLCTTQDIIRTGLAAGGLVAVYWYRLTLGLVTFPWYKHSKSLGLQQSWIVYSCIGLLIVKAMYHRIASLVKGGEDATKSPYSSRLCIALFTPSSDVMCLDCFQTAIVLLSALLVRPHNHCALAFNLFLYLSVYRLIWPVVVEQKFGKLEKEWIQLRTGQLNEAITSTEALGRVALAYWFGQMAYFTMGNSNSFATVDLSAAYIGLSGSAGMRNYISAGFLGVFSTYFGPILWTTMCVTDIIKAKSAPTNNFNSQETSSRSVTCTLSAIRLFSLAVYVAVATGHRYHLFIWSVFSPKLLYEIASTIVHFFLLITITLLW